MDTPFLLYGSYGYTGALIAELAVKRQMKPILAGRDERRLQAQAEQLGLEYRTLRLDSPTAFEAALQDVSLVLNCAGPFSHTYRPVVEACLRAGKHYLDITGEIQVFEGLAGMDLVAKKAGIMLLPGLGMDVVPTDCLAAHLKNRLPSATHLALALGGLGSGFSRGTALTSIEGISGHGVVRSDGKLTPVPLLRKQRQVDFGDGTRIAVNIPWGDVSTAFYSTGIPNIETYTTLPRSTLRMIKLGRHFFALGRLRWVQRLLSALVMRLPPGPTEAARLGGQSRFWGEVVDDRGNKAVAVLRTMEGYTLTSHTTLAGVSRILAGDYKPGFQTPALVFGPDFILEFDGSIREDF